MEEGKLDLLSCCQEVALQKEDPTCVQKPGTYSGTEQGTGIRGKLGFSALSPPPPSGHVSNYNSRCWEPCLHSLGMITSCMTILLDMLETETKEHTDVILRASVLTANT
jgi:hypothetical protein